MSVRAVALDGDPEAPPAATCLDEFPDGALSDLVVGMADEASS